MTAESGRSCSRARRAAASASGPRSPGSERRHPRLFVEGQQRVHPSQIERRHSREPVRPWLEASHDGGSPAERHHRDAPLGADPQQLEHLVVRVGQRHDVGRAPCVAGPHAQQVRCRLSARVPQTRVRVGAELARRSTSSSATASASRGSGSSAGAPGLGSFTPSPSQHFTTASGSTGTCVASPQPFQDWSGSGCRAGKRHASDGTRGRTPSTLRTDPEHPPGAPSTLPLGPAAPVRHGQQRQPQLLLRDARDLGHRLLRRAAAVDRAGRGSPRRAGSSC